MKKLHMLGKVLIAVGVLIALGVAGERVWANRATHPTPAKAVTPALDTQKTYLTMDAFTSSTLDEVPGQLFEAFKKGSLLEVGSWDVPGQAGAKLVAATPTFTGVRENVGCGDSHLLCGIYFTSPATTTLLALGEQLRGFGGLHGFVDADHARIWTAWSLQAYTAAEERSLDIHTGAQTPLVLIELDENGPSAELTVTRGGKKVVVNASGVDEKSKNVPTAVTVSMNGKRVGAIRQDTISLLAVSTVGASERIPAVRLEEDAFPDLKTDLMTIGLYGKFFVLNPETGELQPKKNF